MNASLPPLSLALPRRIFPQVSSPGTGGACARVSFTTNDDQQHLNESPASEAAAGAMGTAGAATTQGPPSAWAEKKQDQASVTSGAIDSRGSSVAKARQLSPAHGGKEKTNVSKKRLLARTDTYHRQ